MATLRAHSPELLVLGRGICRWRPIVAGVLGEIRDMGEVEVLTIGTADEKLVKLGHRTAATVTLKEVTRSREILVKVQGNDFDEDILAAALMGEKDTIAATAGAAVVAEPKGVLGAGHRGIIQTVNPRISLVTVKDTVAVTTLVAGTDYVVRDAIRGFIELLPGGLWLPATSNITVDYTWAAAGARRRIKGGTLSQIEGQLLFSADNAAGPNRDLKVYRMSWTPDGELGLITDEWGQWSLNGKVLDDSAGLYGGTVASPLYELIDAPAAP